MSGQPFFVLGSARSGSTLLRLMLDSHSGLAVPRESHFLLPLVTSFPLDGVLTQDQVVAAVTLVVSHPRFLTWNVSKSEVQSAFMNTSGKMTLRVFVDTLFRLEVGDTRWGDKTPEYTDCWREINQLFPEVQFVWIVRDGRDVSLSLRGVKWFGWTEWQRARYWSSRVALAEECLRVLGASRCMVVRYEDLVLHTGEALRGVCHFLGVEFEASMCRFYETAERNVAEFEKEKIHRKLHRGPMVGDISRWKQEMSSTRRLLFESVAHDDLVSNGYFEFRSKLQRACLRVLGCAYGIAILPLALAERFYRMLPSSMHRSLGGKWWFGALKRYVYS
jgi:hypothetical protein